MNLVDNRITLLAFYITRVYFGDYNELLRARSRFRRGRRPTPNKSIHDGTPNTLLEGIACGCFPIAGDLESIREWITPNENGLLFDSNSPQSIADAIINAIENKNLRSKAAGLNQEIISVRAEYKQNMQRAEEFYKKVCQVNK